MSDAQQGGHRLVLVTGMSGAGKSTALRALEDAGYEAVDNLPLSLLPRIVSATEREGRTTPLALCIDSRTRGFDRVHLERYLDPLLRDGAFLLFLDCRGEALRRRFTETRRRHPLAHDRPVHDGIRRERLILAWIRSRATLTLDTSGLSPRDLARLIRSQLQPETERTPALFVTSFAYREGLPPEADLVFDVRFLANPHDMPALRPLTGLDPQVADHVRRDPVHAEFFDNLLALIRPLLPAFEREGKAYVTIAIGCTGGRHRSVAVAEQLSEALANDGWNVSVRHRDLAPLGESGAELPTDADTGGPEVHPAERVAG